MVDLEEYQNLRERPRERAVMRQRWRSLLFAHFALDAEEIQALLPPGLTVDTFPDSAGVDRAWVGLVPFRMEGVTPNGFPEIPGIHAFPETNVRTYVHHQGSGPGVWFFSLDAASRLACTVARTLFHLPYFEATMSVDDAGSIKTYRSRRWKDGTTADVDCEPQGDVFCAKPGTLEFFLTERYLLYAYKNGQMFSGRVYHAPYRLQRVEGCQISETAVKAAGITTRAFENYLFSPGVDVEVFKLRAC